MSDNQRPVRMRVVNNGMTPVAAAVPQRRRNDPAMLAAAAARTQAQRRGIGLIGAALFLASCAIGGVLVTVSRLSEVLGL